MFRDRRFGALYCGPTSPVALSAKAQSNASQRLFLGRLPLRARRLRGKDYVEEVLPGSHGAPSSNWDFSRHGGDDRLRLRDHGNETVVGLVLLYTLGTIGRLRGLRSTVLHLQACWTAFSLARN